MVKIGNLRPINLSVDVSVSFINESEIEATPAPAGVNASLSQAVQCAVLMQFSFHYGNNLEGDFIRDQHKLGYLDHSCLQCTGLNLSGIISCVSRYCVKQIRYRNSACNNLCRCHMTSKIMTICNETSRLKMQNNKQPHATPFIVQVVFYHTLAKMVSICQSATCVGTLYSTLY